MFKAIFPVESNSENYYLNLVPLGWFFKEDIESKRIFVYAKDLASLYLIAYNLRAQLHETGDYDIEKTLNHYYEINARINNRHNEKNKHELLENLKKF